MNFKHFPVYDYSENLNQILNHGAISFFLKECNGYIAGGCAEAIFKNKSLSKYLKNPEGYSGDIDIYFETKEGLNRAIEYSFNGAHSSYTKEDKEEIDCFPAYDLSVYNPR